MQFNYAYNGSTSVSDSAKQTGMSFSPDLTREPTFFKGKLRKSIAFREAISSLHDVVISDMRYKPKERTEYLEWARKQEELIWLKAGGLEKNVKQELEVVLKELNHLREKSNERKKDFYKHRQEYFKYLYKRDYDAWFVLDPVITVHPDEVFFECFSQDESSYGRLSVSYDVFKNIGEFSCGTTNIDYSAELYNEFQKIRSYKTTNFEIDPSGFEVQTTNEESYKEIKIDLPDSWVRGFLQVNSAMCLPMISFELHPMDIHNLCFILRRHKEIKGPRSLRFQLKPGYPVKVVFEPWNYEVTCPRSIYKGRREEEVRVWGRRRLHILERLIPIAKSFTVHLLGTGMPSFYVADLGDMAFTLGLSGWSSNDWSRAGNFDLMSPREDVDDLTKKKVFDNLKENWFEDADKLASRISLDKTTVLSALSAYAQAGRTIYDLNKNVYRVRELTREPLPMEKLRFSNPREESAMRIVKQNGVSNIQATQDQNGNLVLSGNVRDKSRNLNPKIVIDPDERLIQGECGCSWYYQNKLYKGPCEHMLALRSSFKKRKAVV
jgi:hypothetical protein